MRLWSVHPKYLDAKGLVALWREALLARAVLRGKTRGYRSHPQLHRFRRHRAPIGAISQYLASVRAEALARGYSFDASKLRRPRGGIRLSVSQGQVQYEWRHLKSKLHRRNRPLWSKWATLAAPQLHPLFRKRPGEVESWERRTAPARKARARRPGGGQRPLRGSLRMRADR